MERRVVVTGLGVIAPNGHGLTEFETALRDGTSGLRHVRKMEEAGFACQVGGIPAEWKEKGEHYFTSDRLIAMNELLVYTCIAAIDAWRDAGLIVPESDSDEVLYDTGTIIGIGQSDTDTIARVAEQVARGRVKRLGSTIVEQTMTSAPTARVSELLALGGRATTVSSACTTGSDAIITGADLIRSGAADRMVVGGADTSSVVNWAGFDSMKVMNRNHNATPEQASRPMSGSAGGFIPGSGAGILILEELETAVRRGARIYAEYLSGVINGGGHRRGGSMTLPGSDGVIRGIRSAIKSANIRPDQIDAINGHLTGTMADPMEIQNWANALEVDPSRFPLVNSTKSLVGHCLGAAGGIEAVAAILQLHHGFIHGSVNCEDLHPEIVPFEKSVVQKTVERDVRILAKSSFGFGDVNGITIWKKWGE